MADTSEDTELIFTWDVKEMSREALENEVLSGREQLRKWKRRWRKLKTFWRTYFEEYGIPEPDDPDYNPDNPMSWRPPELPEPTYDELLHGWRKQRNKLAEFSDWITW